MIEAFKAVTLVLGCVVSCGFFWVGYKIWKSDQGDYQQNKDLTEKYLDPKSGTISARRDGVRDYRIKAGLAVNMRNRVWVEQGALSEESIDNILG
ncbi:MAG: hypothetical protein ACYDAX_08290 [Desulfobacteria bacterium]